MAAPLIRHFTENATIDALTGLVVWSLLWVMFIVVLIIMAMGVACHAWFDSMSVDGLNKAMKLTFEKARWWKSTIHICLILGVYIYVEWTGPAILYTITAVGMYIGMMMIKTGINKAFIAQGIDVDLPPSPAGEKA
jgi:hypothetical protein